jgi:predicted CopG family antitoxin
MISIPITQEAYEALKAMMPRIGEAPMSQGRNGQLRISLDRKFVDRILELRRPGESYSDVILRLAGETPRQSAPDIGRGCWPSAPSRSWPA